MGFDLQTLDDEAVQPLARANLAVEVDFLGGRAVRAIRAKPDGPGLAALVGVRASSGFRRAAAFAAPQHAAAGAVLRLDPDRCAAAKQAITACGHRVIAVACDVLETEALRVAIEQVATEFGRLEVLVNNAGGVRGGPS